MSSVQPFGDDRDLYSRGPQEPEARVERRTDRKAIAALVCGVLGLFLFSIVLSPLAIVLGTVSVRATRRDPAVGGRGLAIAGIVLGVIGFLLRAVIIGVALSS